MIPEYIVTAHAVISSICWFIVGCGATYAVFSPKIRDTFWERVALSAVALCSVGTAFRVGRQGWISEGFLMMSIALAIYVIVIVGKHIRGVRYPTPRDKTRPAPLEPTLGRN